MSLRRWLEARFPTTIHNMYLPFSGDAQYLPLVVVWSIPLTTSVMIVMCITCFLWLKKTLCFMCRDLCLFGRQPSITTCWGNCKSGRRPNNTNWINRMWRWRRPNAQLTGDLLNEKEDYCRSHPWSYNLFGSVTSSKWNNLNLSSSHECIFKDD